MLGKMLPALFPKATASDLTAWDARRRFDGAALLASIADQPKSWRTVWFRSADGLFSSIADSYPPSIAVWLATMTRSAFPTWCTGEFATRVHGLGLVRVELSHPKNPEGGDWVC